MRVIPEATETIAIVTQSACPYPSVWSSIIGPLIGVIVGAIITYFITEWRAKKEITERRKWIASGLLIDLQGTKVILDSIPVDTRERAQEAFAGITSPLYPKNGLFSSHYAEIINLGSTIALEIRPLYQNLDKIEFINTNTRYVPFGLPRAFEETGPDAVFHLIVEVKRQIDLILPLLEKIAHDKPKE